MAYEWVLETPVDKEFTYINYITETIPVMVVDEDGEPRSEPGERQIPEEKIEVRKADRVRLSAVRDDRTFSRLFVRFHYGLVEDGEWKGARLDDGMVVSGPDYESVDLDLDGELEEHEVLLTCAKLLGWDGELKNLDDATPLGEAEQA